MRVWVLLVALVSGCVTPDVVPQETARDLAPSGTLRAAINFGNAVLAQKSASGEAQGVTVDLARELARRAGVPLDDQMLAQMLEGAPYALAMVRRLRRDHDVHHEPANVFSFPPSRSPRG